MPSSGVSSTVMSTRSSPAMPAARRPRLASVSRGVSPHCALHWRRATMDEDLRRIGEELERAIAVAIADRRNNEAPARHEAGIPSTKEAPVLTQPRSRRRVVIAAVAGGVLVAAAGTAAATSWLSND